MSLRPTQHSAIRQPYRTPCAAIIAWTVLSVSLWALPQLKDASASLYGTVRDPQGKVVAGAVVHLESKNPTQATEVHSDAAGKYLFSGLREGTYELRATKESYELAQIPSVFLRPNESKSIDLVLGISKKAPDATQPQFFDEPQFTVAGVTDTSNLGGHGSDTVVRTRESIAKETVALGKADSEKAPAADAAVELSVRATADRDPSNFETNLRAGELLLKNGKAKEAIPYLEKSSHLNPGDFQSAYDLALANSQTGNLVHAREGASALLKSNDKAEVHHLLADIGEKLGDPLEAVRHYQRAAELNPTESYVFDWGSELLLHHAPEPATEVFSRGAKSYPRSARMQVGLGAAWFARGSYEEAVKSICAASDLEPGDPDPYIFLGKVQRAEATLSPEVIERLHRFVTLQPENPQASYYYAVALSKLRKTAPEKTSLPQIESLLSKAAQLDPKFIDAELQLGIVNAEAGNYTAAITNYQRALALDPDMEEAHYRLAQAFRQVGQPDKEKAELRLYTQSAAKSAQRADRERHEIRQFVYTLRDQPPSASPAKEP